jgi:hypothetical protein
MWLYKGLTKMCKEFTHYFLIVFLLLVSTVVLGDVKAREISLIDIAKMPDPSKIPVTKEIWYGVNTVTLKAHVICLKRTSFIEQVQTALYGQDLAKIFCSNLKNALKGKVPFRIVESEESPDKIISSMLHLQFEGNPPKMVIMADWRIFTPEELKNLQQMAEALMKSQEEFRAQDAKTAMKNIPKFVGGKNVISSEPRAEEEWLASNGELLKEEMSHTLSALASNVALDMVPK